MASTRSVQKRPLAPEGQEPWLIRREDRLDRLAAFQGLAHPPRAGERVEPGAAPRPLELRLAPKGRKEGQSEGIRSRRARVAHDDAQAGTLEALGRPMRRRPGID